MKSERTITFLMNQPICFSESRGYSTDYVNLIDFFLGLSDNFSKINLMSMTKYGREGKFNLEIPCNVNIIPVPAFDYEDGRFWKFRLMTSTVSSVMRNILKNSDVKSSDAIGFVALSGDGTIGYLISRLGKSKPVFFMVRGDRVKTVYFSEYSSVMKRFIKISRMRCYEIFLCRHIKKGTLVFTQGDALWDRYRRYGKNVHALNAAIDDAIVSDMEAVEPEKGRAFGECIRLLYVGRLSLEKNIKTLICAAAELLEAGENVHLNIVGSGPAEKELRELAEKKNIQGAVTFSGFIPMGERLLGIYDESDIFVLPSFTESLGRSLFEAMARCCIVCASRVGGIPYHIKEGESGFLFSPDNGAEALEKIKQAIAALRDPERKSEILRNALARAGEVTFGKCGKAFAEIMDNYIRDWENK